MTAEKLDVSVTVFCQNEERRLVACIESIAMSAAGMNTAVDVIINGSTDSSAKVAVLALERTKLKSRIYVVDHGDKSNAINRAMREILRPAKAHVFVDGYVTIGRRSLEALAEGLLQTNGPGAATGIATNGRTMKDATAETFEKGGRLHGQLHAFSPEFIVEMTNRGIRLPIGLYRGDALLAAIACYRFDAQTNEWNGKRIEACADATYQIDQLSPFRARDVARQLRRKVRQMRGRMENAALREIERSGGYVSMPEFADDMVADWIKRGGRSPATLSERPFMSVAMRRARQRLRPTEQSLAPVLSWDSSR